MGVLLFHMVVPKDKLFYVSGIVLLRAQELFLNNECKLFH